MTLLHLQTGSAIAWLSLHRAMLKRLGLGVALCLFAGGLFLSLRANPDILGHLRAGPLLIIFSVTLPAGMALSALDFQVLARLSGATIGFWSAVQVNIYSRAANMLPIPGSIAVRMAVLKGHGTAFHRSGGLILLMTAIWGGIGFCFSAAWLAIQAPPALAGAFAAIGIAILTACAVVAHRKRLDWPLLSQAAGLRFALVVVEALALMLALRAIGVDAGYHQTAILVVASFMAGIVPAGIGVRETLIALLAPIAGIDPATGFLAATAARITGMTFLAICATIGLTLARRTRS